MMVSSSQKFKKKHREKKTKKKKMQRREGAYLSSLTSTFGIKVSSCLLLSTFFQQRTLHLPQAMCLTSQSSMLLKLRSSPELEME
jgi:hypothetical protein